jgi:hypothetical protein
MHRDYRVLQREQLKTSCRLEVSHRHVVTSVHNRHQQYSPLSHCHVITLSRYHVVTLSHCHVITLLRYHVVTLSCPSTTGTNSTAHCHTVTLSHCHTVTLSRCHVRSQQAPIAQPTVTLSHCHVVTLSHCHVVTLSRCHVVMSVHNKHPAPNSCPSANMLITTNLRNQPKKS